MGAEEEGKGWGGERRKIDVHVVHVGFRIGDGIEDVIAPALREPGEPVHERGHDAQPRHDVELRGGLAQFGEYQQREQECRDDVDGDRALVLLDLDVLERHDPGVLHHHVQSLEGLALFREGLHAVVAGEVQVPDFHDAGALFRSFDGGFGGVAFVQVTDGEDYFRGIEAHEVSCGFEPQTAVRAGHDDRLAGELRRGQWRREEQMRVNAIDEETHC